MEKFSYRTASDIVKSEAEDRFSRDTETLAAGAGVVVVGTVLSKATSSGKFGPLTPGASNGTQNAAAVLLETVDTDNGDRLVVTLKRHAQVVLQSLVWPEGITDVQKSSALDALEAKGIVARNGV